MNAVKPNKPNQAGAVAIEFALLAPLFLALVFGIVEFGYIMYAKSVITNASREGSRYGVIYSNPRPTSTQVEARVREYLTGASATINTNATVTVTGAAGASGSQLTVTVNLPYTFIVLPNMVQGLTGNITLSGVTVMRIE